MAEEQAWFVDAEDAAVYLADLFRLWLGWTIGLFAMLLTTGLAALIAGIAVFAVLIWLLRPLQRRAGAIADPDAIVGARGIRGRRTARELALGELAYGRDAVAAALALTGRSRAWLWVRTAVVALTIIVAIVVLGDVVAGPA